ncbi:hypothetical protein DL93DRAFT_2102183 [Clavulina sp. PMI_390]|nr:hypothetical protein DL93DRAFT_2102183 [Clavulina sp. PMI_390]
MKDHGGMISLWPSGDHLVAAVLKIFERVRKFALSVTENGARSDERTYHLLRHHISSYLTLLPPLCDPHTFQPWEAFGTFSSSTLFAYITLHGSGLVLHSARARGDLEARHQMVGSMRTLVDVLDKIQRLRRLHGIQTGLVPMLRNSKAGMMTARLCTEYCSGLEILIDYIDDTHRLYPAWAGAPVMLKDQLMSVLNPRVN